MREFIIIKEYLNLKSVPVEFKELTDALFYYNDCKDKDKDLISITLLYQDVVGDLKVPIISHRIGLNRFL